MKKRVSAALLAVLLSLSLAVPAGAAESVPGRLAQAAENAAGRLPRTVEGASEILSGPLPDASGAGESISFDQFSGLLSGPVDAAMASAQGGTYAFQDSYVVVLNEEAELLLGGFVVGKVQGVVLILTTPAAIGSDGAAVVGFDPTGNLTAAVGQAAWDDGLVCLVAVDGGDVPGGVGMMPLAGSSGVSDGADAVRVGVSTGEGGADWALTPGAVITSANYSSGLFSMTAEPGAVAQIGGPVVTGDGGTAIGLSAVAEESLEFISTLDGAIDVLEQLDADYRLASGGGSGSGGVSETGSQGGGSETGSQGGDPEPQGGGSQGGGSQGGGSQGGGLLGDALSGGAIGIVAAVAVGLFLFFRGKKAKAGTAAPAANGVEQPQQQVQQQPQQPFQPTAPVEQYTPQAALTGRGGMMDGRRFPLQGGGVGLGRDPARCAVVYPNGTPGVSAMHCQVVNQGGAWVLMDMGSTYGTFLNGQKLQPSVPCPLRPGDSFYLGQPDNTFVFEGG